MSSTAKSIDPAPGTATVEAAVWDLPVRLFHWLLVAMVAFSWWSAENDEIELHLWSGYAILALITFRVLWGFFGSSTARFGNFIKSPRVIAGYIRNSRAWKEIGHSPLGALSVLAMLVVLKLQIATGLINADDDGLVQGSLAHAVSVETSDFAHDFHETLFNVLLVLIVLHIAAILFYRAALGKGLIGPMIHGRASVDPAVAPMRPARWWTALACLAAAIAVTRWLIAGAPPFGV